MRVLHLHSRELQLEKLFDGCATSPFVEGQDHPADSLFFHNVTDLIHGANDGRVYKRFPDVLSLFVEKPNNLKVEFGAHQEFPHQGNARLCGAKNEHLLLIFHTSSFSLCVGGWTSKNGQRLET